MALESLHRSCGGRIDPDQADCDIRLSSSGDAVFLSQLQPLVLSVNPERLGLGRGDATQLIDHIRAAVAGYSREFWAKIVAMGALELDPSRPVSAHALRCTTAAGPLVSGASHRRAGWCPHLAPSTLGRGMNRSSAFRCVSGATARCPSPRYHQLQRRPQDTCRHRPRAARPGEDAEIPERRRRQLPSWRKHGRLWWPWARFVGLLDAVAVRDALTSGWATRAYFEISQKRFCNRWAAAAGDVGPGMTSSGAGTRLSGAR